MVKSTDTCQNSRILVHNAMQKKEKKETIENNQVDLKEILGDIKTLVSGETETLFKLSEYKTIKLKKENLVSAGEKKYTSGNINAEMDSVDRPRI